jgi:hypothetical protein
MIIFELAKPTDLDNGALTNYSPFVYFTYPSTWATGDYWSTLFGAPAESDNRRINITAFAREAIYRYSRTESIVACQAQERSFYWDFDNQVFYVHVEHDVPMLSSSFQYYATSGYTNRGACYIGNIFYAPFLKSIPSLAQAQDLVAYDRPSFISGSVALSNISGEFDDAIDLPYEGLDCFIGYVDDDDADANGDFLRSDITYLASLYVERAKVSQREASLSVQDRRKAASIKIPTAVFDSVTYPDAEDSVIGKPIPLAYGEIRVAPAICVNGNVSTGNVRYRVAKELTAIGTVQVKSGDVWTTVTPDSVTLASGTFELTAATGRNSGSPRECRVLGCVGTAVASASDIIVSLNTRFSGVAYTSSEYDTTEWEATAAELSTVGILLDKQVELYEIIRQIQTGANLGFRYEFLGTGQRTIRTNSFDRTPAFRIYREDLADCYDLPFDSDPNTLAARIKISYANDYDKGEMQSVLDESRVLAVRCAYGVEPQLDFDTLLTTKAAATARAALEASRYGQLRKLVHVKCSGETYLGVRIFDTAIAELTPAFVNADDESISGSRDWLGVWKVQVLSVAPDFDAEANELGLVLIERAEAS